MERKTIQKEIIYQQIMSMNNHPTAEDVYNAITAKYPKISRGTVYRVLNNLADNNRILRLHILGNVDVYDYKNYNHAHFLCEHCAKVYDFDVNSHKVKIDVNENERGFLIKGYSLVFQGLCPKCQNKEREN